MLLSCGRRVLLGGIAASISMTGTILGHQAAIAMNSIGHLCGIRMTGLLCAINSTGRLHAMDSTGLLHATDSTGHLDGIKITGHLDAINPAGLGLSIDLPVFNLSILQIPS